MKIIKTLLITLFLLLGFSFTSCEKEGTLICVDNTTGSIQLEYISTINPDMYITLEDSIILRHGDKYNFNCVPAGEYILKYKVYQIWVDGIWENENYIYSYTIDVIRKYTVKPNKITYIYF